ncbi:MAG TPA: hemerythrin domain-containing protein [Acidimicrobiales bacterium]|jgi:hemerythrin superfamily protein|nr:hemerythrin domain-containing protein [Acidimicrobiales bacterium]
MTDIRTVDIVDLLSRDHQEAKQLLEQITGAPASAREDLFWELVPELVRHEVAEEVVVYPTIRAKAPDGDAEVEPRLKEQREAEAMLADLEKLDPTSPEFATKLAELRDDVLDHAQAEEQNIFPLLRALEHDDDRRQLGARYEKAKTSAPTHPHPHAPDRPPGNKILGPIAAFADRVRDAAKGL